MMNAYDRIYLEKARCSLGRMLDYAVYDLGLNLANFWELFIVSPIAKRFEIGDVSVVAGRSGAELALMVLDKQKDYQLSNIVYDRSQEYWLGWAIAYYQWQTHLSFFQITEFLDINQILKMYTPYHEMDIRQFCDKLTEIRFSSQYMTNLKKRRLAAGLSQSELARITNIPLRTIQQYEQRQKDINKANAEYVISFARALYCNPETLLENA